jgi:hypothetical protein
VWAAKKAAGVLHNAEPILLKPPDYARAVFSRAGVNIVYVMVYAHDVKWPPRFD